jgi:hypothetical protein
MRNADGIISPRSALTMLSRLQRPLRKLVVGLVGGGDDDQIDVLVFQDVVQSRVDGSNDAEPFLEFAPLGLRAPLQDGVQGEAFWQGENEGHMKGETGQAGSQDASTDGFHLLFCGCCRGSRKLFW